MVESQGARVGWLGLVNATGKRRVRRVAAALLAGLLVVAVVASTVRLRRIDDDAAAARRRGAAAELSARGLEGELDQATRDLRRARLALKTAREDQEAAEGERVRALSDHEAVEAELDRVGESLAALERALSGAEGDAAANTALAAALGECLEGISAFLNQLAVHDDHGALRTVERIGGVCATVGTVLT